MTLFAPSRKSVTVSVIIPTTCEAKRWHSLQRAIATAREQDNAAVSVIVVVNGERFVPENLETLRRDPALTVLYQQQGSAPLAQQLGRQAVRTEFFAFLDDDDEYLPGALGHRVQPMLDQHAIAFVASNGYRHTEGRDMLAVSSAAALRADPLLSLCNENWLASCGGLFRSASVGPEFFEEPAAYLEWTYLAYKLALKLPMAWVDTPTYRIHDTAGSLSKSAAYREAELGVLERILALGLPPRVATRVRNKIGRACHDLAHQHVLQAMPAVAWRYHALSLRQPGGWRYLLYSRKLLALAWRKPVPAHR